MVHKGKNIYLGILHFCGSICSTDTQSCKSALSSQNNPRNYEWCEIITFYSCPHSVANL